MMLGAKRVESPKARNPPKRKQRKNLTRRARRHRAALSSASTASSATGSTGGAPSMLKGFLLQKKKKNQQHRQTTTAIAAATMYKNDDSDIDEQSYGIDDESVDIGEDHDDDCSSIMSWASRRSSLGSKKKTKKSDQHPTLLRQFNKVTTSSTNTSTTAASTSTTSLTATPTKTLTQTLAHPDAAAFDLHDLVSTASSSSLSSSQHIDGSTTAIIINSGINKTPTKVLNGKSLARPANPTNSNNNKSLAIRAAFGATGIPSHNNNATTRRAVLYNTGASVLQQQQRQQEEEEQERKSLIAAKSNKRHRRKSSFLKALGLRKNDDCKHKSGSDDIAAAETTSLQDEEEELSVYSATASLRHGVVPEQNSSATPQKKVKTNKLLADAPTPKQKNKACIKKDTPTTENVCIPGTSSTTVSMLPNVFRNSEFGDSEEEDEALSWNGSTGLLVKQTLDAVERELNQNTLLLDGDDGTATTSTLTSRPSFPDVVIGPGQPGGEEILSVSSWCSTITDENNNPANHKENSPLADLQADLEHAEQEFRADNAFDHNNPRSSSIFVPKQDTLGESPCLFSGKNIEVHNENELDDDEDIAVLLRNATNPRMTRTPTKTPRKEEKRNVLGTLQLSTEDKTPEAHNLGPRKKLVQTEQDWPEVENNKTLLLERAVVPTTSEHEVRTHSTRGDSISVKLDKKHEAVKPVTGESSETKNGVPNNFAVDSPETENNIPNKFRESFATSQSASLSSLDMILESPPHSQEITVIPTLPRAGLLGKIADFTSKKKTPSDISNIDEGLALIERSASASSSSPSHSLPSSPSRASPSRKARTLAWRRVQRSVRKAEQELNRTLKLMNSKSTCDEDEDEEEGQDTSSVSTWSTIRNDGQRCAAYVEDLQKDLARADQEFAIQVDSKVGAVQLTTPSSAVTTSLISFTGSNACGESDASYADAQQGPPEEAGPATFDESNCEKKTEPAKSQARRLAAPRPTEEVSVIANKSLFNPFDDNEEEAEGVLFPARKPRKDSEHDNKSLFVITSGLGNTVAKAEMSSDDRGCDEFTRFLYLTFGERNDATISGKLWFGLCITLIATIGIFALISTQSFPTAAAPAMLAISASPEPVLTEIVPSQNSKDLVQLTQPFGVLPLSSHFGISAARKNANSGLAVNEHKSLLPSLPTIFSTRNDSPENNHSSDEELHASNRIPSRTSFKRRTRTAGLDRTASHSMENPESSATTSATGTFKVHEEVQNSTKESTVSDRARSLLATTSMHARQVSSFIKIRALEIARNSNMDSTLLRVRSLISSTLSERTQQVSSFIKTKTHLIGRHTSKDDNKVVGRALSLLSSTLSKRLEQVSSLMKTNPVCDEILTQHMGVTFQSSYVSLRCGDNH